MKTRKIQLLAAIVLFALNACTNDMDDMDILNLDRQTVGFEMDVLFSEITTEEADRQMKNSMLRLTGKRELRVSKNSLTIDDFFGNSEACFPAYKESLAYFELYTYDSLKNDTLMFHYKMEYMEEYVDSILNDINDYTVYELTWKYKASKLNTIALYDSNDGLVYDNILFNIIEFRITKDKNNKNILSRSEYPPGNYFASGSDFVEFYDKSNYLRAQAFLWWYECGHMNSAPIYNQHGEIIALYYYYVHDDVIQYTDQWIDTYNGYNKKLSIINRFEDFSTSNAGQYIYCLWVGPKTLMPNVDPYFQYYYPNYKINFTHVIPSGEWAGYSIQGVLDSPYFQQPGYTEYL